MSAIYIVTISDIPLAAARTLVAAKADAETREARYGPAETRWVERGEKTWRLMSRMEGRSRFAWSTYAVHAVPEVTR